MAIEKNNSEKKLDKYTYPWNELEEEFRSNTRISLPVVGFGSLLNVESARRNFPNTPSPAVPLKAFGFQRVYDYFIISERYDKYTVEEKSFQPCALNAYPSEHHWMCGVELSLTKELFEGFRQREKFYDLYPVKACAWGQDTPDRTCYILSKPPKPDIDPEIMFPHPQYHHVCTKGAADISQEFLEAFHETTYFADRKTRISEKICPRFDVLKKSPSL